MITIKFNRYENDEPIFSGKISNKSFEMIKVLTDIDYGWHPISYLTGEADNLTEDEWERIEEFIDLNEESFTHSIV